MPVIYPINFTSSRDFWGNSVTGIVPILSDNNGHRCVPAWAVPDSEVPLICSDPEWEMIKARDRKRLGIDVSFDPAGLEVKPCDLLRPRKRDNSFVRGYIKEVTAGGWRERRCCSMVSGGCNIHVLPREVDTETGELLRPYVKVSDCVWDGETAVYNDDDVKYMESHGSRADNMRSVRESCNRFKWLVRANERRVRLFLTLTYAENMQDTHRLYQDFRRFFPRLRRLCPDIDGYLCACEPQKRGAWHMHVLLLSRKKSLYISNKRVCSLWGRGFTKTQAVRSVRDVGAYLTAYLSNIRDGRGTQKGARLSLYPVGFRFCRWSRSIDRPENATFYGCFGDHFRDLESYEMCFDYQDLRRSIDGKKFITRIALFYREKPK